MNINEVINLRGKCALVSGASRGIGQAIALKLASCGAQVIGTATSESGANSITQMLQNAAVPGSGIVLNLGSAESIDNAVTNFMELTGSAPQILVNNAGITKDNLLLRMKSDEWDDVINTNLTGTYRLIKACSRNMVKQRFGRIINIGSVIGSMGNPGQANYAAAKAGIIGMSKSLARELGSRNITVNVVSPGFIETDMTKSLSDEQKEFLQEQIALRKLGDVEDVANAVLFLASELARYITGETLHVNGGMYMI